MSSYYCNEDLVLTNENAHDISHLNWRGVTFKPFNFTNDNYVFTYSVWEAHDSPKFSDKSQRVFMVSYTAWPLFGYHLFPYGPDQDVLNWDNKKTQGKANSHKNHQKTPTPQGQFTKYEDGIQDPFERFNQRIQSEILHHTPHKRQIGQDLWVTAATYSGVFLLIIPPEDGSWYPLIGRNIGMRLSFREVHGYNLEHSSPIHLDSSLPWDIHYNLPDQDNALWLVAPYTSPMYTTPMFYLPGNEILLLPYAGFFAPTEPAWDFYFLLNFAPLDYDEFLFSGPIIP